MGGSRILGGIRYALSQSDGLPGGVFDEGHPEPVLAEGVRSSVVRSPRIRSKPVRGSHIVGPDRDAGSVSSRHVFEAEALDRGPRQGRAQVEFRQVQLEAGAGEASDIEGLDPASRTIGSRKSGIRGEQRNPHDLGQGDIHGVPAANVFPQFPCPAEQEAVAEPLGWPGEQIVHGERGLGLVQAPSEQVSPDDAEDLHVDDVGGDLIRIGGKASPDLVRARRSDQHLVQTRGVNDEHRAKAHAVRRSR